MMLHEKTRLDIRRVDSEVSTIRSSGTVSSYGILFGLLRDAEDDSVVGVGFETSGRQITFWRARSESGTTLEQSDGTMEFLDGVLRRLRIFDEDREAFRGEWSRILEVYRAERSKSPPRPVHRLRDALANMRPEVARALSELLASPNADTAVEA